MRRTYQRAEFLSTLSLRRATLSLNTQQRYLPFLSTLSLRRATPTLHNILKLFAISIHALLAESDYTHPVAVFIRVIISIHALLAESDVTDAINGRNPDIISIHALLAESDIDKIPNQCQIDQFLSTLSLRRATCYSLRHSAPSGHFYPRSPCGERHFVVDGHTVHITNFYPRSPCGERRVWMGGLSFNDDFYPRSPCGERPILDYFSAVMRQFLSTLSLRRATW